MQRFYIRDVCRILNLKPHIIRYWEEEVPFLAPRKDISRIRIYTFHELSLFFRLKYLVYTRKLSLPRAADKLWREITAEDQEKRVMLHELRVKLLVLYTETERLNVILNKFFEDKVKLDDIESNADK